MGRKPTGNDATNKLRPRDETQVAPEGTKIGALKRSHVLSDFRKIVSGKRKRG